LGTGIQHFDPYFTTLVLESPNFAPDQFFVTKALQYKKKGASGSFLNNHRY
jgi:hypothetical protein